MCVHECVRVCVHVYVCVCVHVCGHTLSLNVMSSIYLFGVESLITRNLLIVEL